MNVEEIRAYCIAKKAVTEGFPFDNDTLVFKVAGKMFALLALEKNDVLNLKCDPERAIELREKFDFIEAGYHMNKQHWNTVHFFQAGDPLTKELIDHSYELIVNSLPKKKRMEFDLG